LNELSWFPSARGDGVVLPVYKVEELASFQLGVQHRLDLKLFFSSNDKRARI
jgi:hypothetical protein